MEEPAFKRLYEMVAPSLFVYVLRSTSDRELARDITHDAFVRWLQKGPDGLTDVQARAYLYRTATNLVTDHHRRQTRWVREDFVNSISDSDPDHAWSLDFHRAFQHLDSRQRSLLWLAYAEDYTHEEIGSILKLRPGSVKVLVFRARQKFREILDKIERREP